MTTAVTNPTEARKSLAALINGDAMRKQFALALPKALPIDRFLRCLMTTINRDPKLLECDRQSVMAGAMTAAQLGLEIDPALGRAYLLPYNGKAQLIIGYKGYVDLAYRSGQLAGIQAEAVYEADHFEYQLGLDPKLIHVPADKENRGALKYAYAVATLSNGGKAWRVLNRSQVMKHKAKSQSAGSNYSPWKTHEEEMWRKTAIRALSSILPLSPELRDAVAADAEPEDSVANAAYAGAMLDVPGEVVSTQPADPPPGDVGEPAGAANPFARMAGGQ
jgi:recombination protein RecT